MRARLCASRSYAARSPTLRRCRRRRFGARPSRAEPTSRCPTSRATHSVIGCERALEYIAAGDIFQVQVSRRFALPLQAHPFDVYVALRAINPSPYMIYIATPECTLVGASPEMLVQVLGTDHPVPPDRRHATSRQDAGGRRAHGGGACAAVRRRRRSTSCSSTSGETISGACARPDRCVSRSTWRSSATRM